MDITVPAGYHKAMPILRAITVITLLVLSACGGEELPNSTRAGYVALSGPEAWQKIKREMPEYQAYALCPDINVPCAPQSAYLRDRGNTYWFALHDVAEPCDHETCPLDLFSYIEISQLGESTAYGTAIVQYNQDGLIRQVIGEPRWNMPNLEQPKIHLQHH